MTHIAHQPPDLPLEAPGVPQGSENAVAGPADGKASILERGFGITMICGTCLYWAGKYPEHGSMADCRYGPPVVHIVDKEAWSEWPTTDHYDWCGKWMPNPAASPFGRVDPDVRHAVEDVRINRGPSEVTP